MKEHLYFLVTETGEIRAVQISTELWKRVESRVRKALADLECAEDSRPEPLDDFETFMKYWDFPYSYNPAVTCPHCGASAADWRTEPGHPFHLSNATLGGLLVFRCKCGTIIRQKHFKDHVAYEHDVVKND